MGGDVRACCSVLGRTAHTLSSVLEESEIIRTLIDQVMPVFGARAAIVRLVSADGNELLTAGSRGLSEAYLGKGPVLISRGPVDRRVMAGETVVMRDIVREPGLQYPKEAAEEGLKGMVAAPLTVRDRVTGVFRVYVDDVDRLSADDLALLDIMTDFGALALEKVRIHQSLYRIAEALNSSLELEPMLQQVLERAVERMGFMGASVRMKDPRGEILHLVAAHGLSSAYLEKGDVHLSKSGIDRRVLEGETVVLYDVHDHEGLEYPEAAAREGIRSVLATPLRLQEQVPGVLRVYSARSLRQGSVDTSFLVSVANLVALAVEKAELYGALKARYEDLRTDLSDWYQFLALG